MDGSSLGRAIAGGIIAAVALAFVAGGVLFLGGYFLLSWIADHISIGWN